MNDIKENKFIVSVKVGPKGQITIPSIARNMFNINIGDTLMVVGDKNKGIALIKADEIYKIIGDKIKWQKY